MFPQWIKHPIQAQPSLMWLIKFIIAQSIAISYYKQTV